MSRVQPHTHTHTNTGDTCTNGDACTNGVSNGDVSLTLYDVDYDDGDIETGVPENMLKHAIDLTTESDSGECVYVCVCVCIYAYVFSRL